MSNSNIGARKNRNIRDHLLVINSILHDLKGDKDVNIDIETYDIKKCFDKMWSSETSNDLFDAGLDDDKVVLVANSNESCDVAIKTSWGSTTERFELNNVELQGTVITPLKCSIQLDSLGKEICSDKNLSETLYKFKGFLKIPPLALIDDLLTINTCGINSVKMNGLVQSKVDSRRLELGNTKYFQMHIGKNRISCPTLKVDTEEMNKVTKQTYLGDIITSDAKVDENVAMRRKKELA